MVIDAVFHCRHIAGWWWLPAVSPLVHLAPGITTRSRRCFPSVAGIGANLNVSPISWARGTISKTHSTENLHENRRDSNEIQPQHMLNIVAHTAEQHRYLAQIHLRLHQYKNTPYDRLFPAPKVHIRVSPRVWTIAIHPYAVHCHLFHTLGAPCAHLFDLQRTNVYGLACWVTIEQNRLQREHRPDVAKCSSSQNGFCGRLTNICSYRLVLRAKIVLLMLGSLQMNLLWLLSLLR